MFRLRDLLNFWLDLIIDIVVVSVPIFTLGRAGIKVISKSPRPRPAGFDVNGQEVFVGSARDGQAVIFWNVNG